MIDILGKGTIIIRISCIFIREDASINVKMGDDNVKMYSQRLKWWARSRCACKSSLIGIVEFWKMQ